MEPMNVLTEYCQDIYNTHFTEKKKKEGTLRRKACVLIGYIETTEARAIQVFKKTSIAFIRRN